MVEGRVTLSEELASNDTGCVGGHDEHSHSDGAFTSGPGVESHP